MDMFLKNITFLNFSVKMSAKTFFLFKVREAGAGAILKITAGAGAASFLAGSDSLVINEQKLSFGAIFIQILS